MLMFEWILVLLLATVILTNLAERLAVPYPCSRLQASVLLSCRSPRRSESNRNWRWRCSWRRPFSTRHLTPRRALVVAATESPSPTVARVEFSIKHRRQIGAVGFVVETDRHQVHLVHEAHAVFQAPAEHVPIAGRQQKSATREARSRTDQRRVIAKSAVQIAY